MSLSITAMYGNGMNCPCCGGEMKKERELASSILVRCSECGLSDTQARS